MELIRSAKTIRLKSHHDKYLLADEDEEHVLHDREGSVRNARWTVEFPETSDSVFRLKSCYGRYLTASNEPFLLGMTGRKVLQTLPTRLDSSIEWEPVRDGFKVKLKTRYGTYVRVNGGVKPWRNSITHGIPKRTSTQDWVLWAVEIVEARVQNNVSVAMNGTGSMRMAESRISNSRNELLRNERLSFRGTSVAELTEKLEKVTEITEGISSLITDGGITDGGITEGISSLITDGGITDGGITEGICSLFINLLN